jgi:integrase
MKRRTVKTISRFYGPEEIYSLITAKAVPYKRNRKFNNARDRALMALGILTAGRISEILTLETRNFDLKESPHYIVVRDMPIAKRSKKVVEKYGVHVKIRFPFILPLSTNPKVYEKPQVVKLVPFTKLVLDYLKLLGPKNRRLFNFSPRWAWEIIYRCTGMFPNWFRAQAEMIHGSYLKDSVKLAKFVGVVRPEQVAHYIGYDYKELLSGKT